MRDKFSELIEKGIASFDYVPTQPSAPSQCPLCREYNNIFSIPSDTHMSEVNGRHIITGHIIADARPGNPWERFMSMSGYSGVDFRPSGYYCLGDFFYKHGLEGHREILNGDTVWALEPRRDDPTAKVVANPDTKVAEGLNESSIKSGLERNENLIAVLHFRAFEDWLKKQKIANSFSCVAIVDDDTIAELKRQHLWDPWEVYKDNDGDWTSVEPYDGDETPVSDWTLGPNDLVYVLEN